MHCAFVVHWLAPEPGMTVHAWLRHSVWLGARDDALDARDDVLDDLPVQSASLMH